VESKAWITSYAMERLPAKTQSEDCLTSRIAP
jgi:hypothetical protein